MLPFDTTRAPMREQEFADLVRAVVRARPGDESGWIEWKRPLDLGSPEGKAAVARCIIALANRQPDDAARFCEGRGYMVIGAEPGALKGQAEEDPADLSNWWDPYLGTDGPRWSPHWLNVDGATVLIIEVAAPRPGDPLHTVRKATTNLRDGDVFVRRPGKSERATSAEIAALVRRANSAGELMGIAVMVTSGPIRPVAFSEEDLDDWMGAVREECLSSLKAAQPAPTPSSDKPVKSITTTRPDGERSLSLRELMALTRRDEDGEELTTQEMAQLDQGRQAMEGIAEKVSMITSGFFSTKPEERTPDQYRLEVERFLLEYRGELPVELRSSASTLLAACQIAIRNETATNMEGVQLVLHVPGDADAVAPEEDGPGLPNPPRPFGPRTVNRLGLVNGITPYVSIPAPNYSWFPPGFSIQRGGSVTLRFESVHLRPHDTVYLPEVALLLSHSTVGTWEATSTSANGLLRGDLDLPVEGPALTVEEALRPPGSDES